MNDVGIMEAEEHRIDLASGIDQPFVLKRIITDVLNVPLPRDLPQLVVCGD